jgi:hypothetical protein
MIEDLGRFPAQDPKEKMGCKIARNASQTSSFFEFKERELAAQETLCGSRFHCVSLDLGNAQQKLR